RALSGTELAFSLTVLLALLGYIFYSRGGSIQEIVKAKTNTVDIRSATIIDFLYALVLLFFKQYSNVPMSTTWVFLGLLAGREIAIRLRLGQDRSQVEPDAMFKYLGWLFNAAILVMIGVAVYYQKDMPDYLIFAFAGVIIARAAVAFFEAIKQAVDIKGTYRMIGMDLAKVTLGLVMSVGLVYLMKFLTDGAVG
ncbi:MAG: hypothetical protein AAGA62_16975, partial [Bacteroidota bacterium]